jgi:hypothetical protein
LAHGFILSLKPKAFFWQISHDLKQVQSNLENDLEQMKSDLKSLGLLRLATSDHTQIDIDTAYSIAYFEMEQIRLIKMILPDQSLETQEKLMERLRFLEDQFELWLDYLSKK